MSVKIPQELKEKLEQIGAKPSQLLRKAIEEAIINEEVKKIKEEIGRLKDIVSKIPLEDVIKSVREDRDRR